MGKWKYASKPEDDGTVEITVTLQSDDTTGALTGTVDFRKSTYTVGGSWAAAGSVPGRAVSVFWFGGDCESVATHYLVAAGDLGTHAGAAYMNIAVVTANSADGQDFGYNGQLAAS
jgi:hypothetical protein